MSKVLQNAPKEYSAILSTFVKRYISFVYMCVCFTQVLLYNQIMQALFSKRSNINAFAAMTVETAFADLESFFRGIQLLFFFC